MKKYRTVTVLLSVFIAALVASNLPQPAPSEESISNSKQLEVEVSTKPSKSIQPITPKPSNPQSVQSKDAAEQPVRIPAFNKKLLNIKQYGSFNISIPGVGEYIVEVESVNQDKVLGTKNINGFVVGEYGFTNKAYVSVSERGVSGMVSTPNGRYGFKSGKSGELKFTKVEFTHDNLH